jgi:hypothetical protein
MTVERLCQQARSRRLTDSAGARENVGMVQSLMLDSVAQRTGNWFLARDFLESLRAPFASDYLIGHKQRMKDEGGRMK